MGAAAARTSTAPAAPIAPVRFFIRYSSFSSGLCRPPLESPRLLRRNRDLPSLRTGGFDRMAPAASTSLGRPSIARRVPAARRRTGSDRPVDWRRIAGGGPGAALHPARAGLVRRRRQTRGLTLERMRAELARLLRLRAPTVDAGEVARTGGATAGLTEGGRRSFDASARCAVASRSTMAIRGARAPRRGEPDASTPEAEPGALRMARVGVGLPSVRRERVRSTPARGTGDARRSAEAGDGRPTTQAMQSVATLERRPTAGPGLEPAMHDAPAARGDPR